MRKVFGGQGATVVAAGMGRGRRGELFAGLDVGARQIGDSENSERRQFSDLSVLGEVVGSPGSTIFNMIEMPLVTAIWPEEALFVDEAVLVDSDVWWNRERVFTEEQSVDAGDVEGNGDGREGCQRDRSCWRRDGRAEGSYSVLSTDCSVVSPEVCFAQRMGNLSGVFVGCYETSPQFETTQDTMDKRLYEGQYNRAFQDDAQEEFLQGFNFHGTTRNKLNVTVMYNDTTVAASFRTGSFNVRPRMARINDPVRLALDAFINWRMGAEPFTFSAACLGLKEMPKPANIIVLDLGSLVGPFLFTLVFSLLLPVMIVSLVYEKEVRLRVLMKMLGLGSFAYWVINYFFWLVVYILFSLVFFVFGSTVRLPSGYKIGIVATQKMDVLFVFTWLFINNTIAFAFLSATLFKTSRTAQVTATLWVVGMSLIGWASWDVQSGNLFNVEDVSVHAKNAITMFPMWAFFRGWMEFQEYASFDTGREAGMRWSDIGPDGDPRNGMSVVLSFLAIEWPIFLIIALYLDQVIDSGRGVPMHPLFFLGYGRTLDEKGDSHVGMRVEGGGEGVASDGRKGGGVGTAGDDDVEREVRRIQAQLALPSESRDAVLMNSLRKVYFPGTRKSTEAVKNLTMGVAHGEVFGMLGPNGAGKTTTINMLVGFAAPTSGWATLHGFNIRTHMHKIYTLMGVCPQHDILWDPLTARQHLLFYGRLKNLKGQVLEAALIDALKQVNLDFVMDEKVLTFSGGMKRRLSVAIALIGAPVCCYLDEPSTGLDPASRRTLWKCIKRAKKDRTIFLTTHSMEEAEHLCDRLGIFVDGALKCMGSPKQLTARYGGAYVLTLTCEPGKEDVCITVIQKLAPDARITYALARTFKFEIPVSQVRYLRMCISCPHILHPGMVMPIV